MINSNLKFRFGTKADVKKIGGSLKESWLMHVDNEPEFVNREVIESSDLVNYFQHCFDGSEKSYLIIAEIENKIAGFAKVNIEDIQRFFNQTKVLYIDDIYTLKEFRRKGVSTALLKEAEKLAKDKNIKWLKARVYTFNKPPQKALESVGYKNLYSEYFKIIE